ncbi:MULTISPECIES: FHA domain-containing protein [unclassified Curtobacterium]|uniref:FHA domain-containing protein FhaB/FipA n=1 Tax=unclassified Curtobacterium TaxID=257496 RepID=UPI00082678CB|nr:MULTISPECIES: FHA domain-containing protein [unclassified Curtobacterium]WIA96827.1 FHA domain-containing protein [Curtobacterium sp. MCBA15_004]WIB00126.1 FHA domain-containing protein [Curtobacterium sp. MCBA15_012]
MTTGLTLLVLRFAFLAVLWLFVFVIVFALRSDLFGQRVRTIPTDPKAAPSGPTTPVVPAAAAPAAASGGAFTELIGQSSGPTPQQTASGVPTRLVITEGAREGLEMPLGGGPITIGRSSESNVVIRDDYTSTHHARLELRASGWVLTDLESTNGTFVDGQKVTTPVTIAERTPITIGTTTFELRR